MIFKAIYSLTPSILLSGPSSGSTASNNNALRSKASKLAVNSKDIEAGQKSLLFNTTNNNFKNVINYNDKDKDKKHSNKSGSFPIPMALTILILWIAFSAAMFCLWETEWGFFTSVYFFFVSIR